MAEIGTAGPQRDRAFSSRKRRAISAYGKILHVRLQHSLQRTLPHLVRALIIPIIVANMQHDAPERLQHARLELQRTE